MVPSGFPTFHTFPRRWRLPRIRTSKTCSKVFAIKFKATYPFVLPPEVPADHVNAIRTAFDAAIRDSAFLESAKKGGLPIRPMRGVDIEHLISESLKTPEKTLRATARGCAAVAGNVECRERHKSASSLMAQISAPVRPFTAAVRFGH